jgi:acetate kinase
MDEPQNAANARVISTSTGRIAVRVIHTDEEQMIAKTVCSVLGLV